MAQDDPVERESEVEPGRGTPQEEAEEEAAALEADAQEEEGEDDERVSGPRRLAGKVKRGLVSIATATYDARADDMQERSVRAMRKALHEETERIVEVAKETYDARADDLEERAVRAMRKALMAESRRIRALIEHSVSVKRREVRLSLLVLVAANLVYLVVYWLTAR